MEMTTFIFLCLAMFVIWRLKSVLGQKTGFEQKPMDPFSKRENLPQQKSKPLNGEADNVINLNPNTENVADNVIDRWKGIAETGTTNASNLDDIVALETTFDPLIFIEGAKMAYEMIVMSFAKGDKKALKDLLSKEVYDGFVHAIEEREKRLQTSETTFVSIDRPEIIAVELHNKLAQITVRFQSKIITVTRDKNAEIVEGGIDKIVDVTDIWTFARTLLSKDPNWLLVATEAGSTD